MAINEIDKILLELYIEAEKEIIDTINEALNSWKTIINQDAILKDIQVQIANLSNNSNLWAQVRIPEEYLKWVNKVDNSDTINEFIKDPKKPSEYTEFIWAELWQIHLEAVNNLITESINYINNNLNWIDRWARITLAKWSQAKILEDIAKREITWKSMEELKQSIIDTLKKQGLTVLKDKSWKSWSLSRYAEVIARSETAKAQIQWTLTRWVELWIAEYRRVENPNCCDICASHNWEIWNIEKQWVPVYLYHPNCNWTWEPIIN